MKKEDRRAFLKSHKLQAASHKRQALATIKRYKKL